jgi:hypothetical protein
VGALVGTIGFVLGLVKRVRDGRGADHYTAMSGLEWSALPVLVVLVLGVTISLVGGVLRWYFERSEERDFIAVVRERLKKRKAAQSRSRE